MHLITSCGFSPLVRPAGALRPGRRPSRKKRAACRRDDAEFSCGSEHGRLVDEGMVVLRRRIHEAKAAESGWEPPAEWEASEKEWYGTYDGDVCALAAALQAFLGARPAVGVGVVAVLMLGVPASVFVLLCHLLDASRAILSSTATLQQ